MNNASALKKAPAQELVNPEHKATPVSGEQFSRYGNIFVHINGATLAEDEDTVARVEQSGSEGFYVEVARWDETAGRWARYAFLKVFDQNTARVLAEQININGKAMTPIFHRLPDHSDRPDNG